MWSWRWRGALYLAAIVLIGFAVFGRGARISGTYESVDGYLTIEFRGSRASMMMPTGTAEAEYAVEGSRVIVRSAGGSIILTRNADGSFDGPMGRMIKQDE
jgi:hypothetical protein